MRNQLFENLLMDAGEKSPYEWMAFIAFFSARWMPTSFRSFKEDVDNTVLGDFQSDLTCIQHLALKAAERTDLKIAHPLAGIDNVFANLRAIRSERFARQETGNDPDQPDPSQFDPAYWMARISFHASQWMPGHAPEMDDKTLMAFREAMTRVADAAMAASECIELKLIKEGV